MKQKTTTTTIKNNNKNPPPSVFASDQVYFWKNYRSLKKHIYPFLGCNSLMWFLGPGSTDQRAGEDRGL